MFASLGIGKKPVGHAPFTPQSVANNIKRQRGVAFKSQTARAENIKGHLDTIIFNAYTGADFLSKVCNKSFTTGCGGTGSRLSEDDILNSKTLANLCEKDPFLQTVIVQYRVNRGLIAEGLPVTLLDEGGSPSTDGLVDYLTADGAASREQMRTDGAADLGTLVGGHRVASTMKEQEVASFKTKIAVMKAQQRVTAAADASGTRLEAEAARLSRELNGEG